jgi:hypothetical protein
MRVKPLRILGSTPRGLAWTSDVFRGREESSDSLWKRVAVNCWSLDILAVDQRGQSIVDSLLRIHRRQRVTQFNHPIYSKLTDYSEGVIQIALKCLWEPDCFLSVLILHFSHHTQCFPTSQLFCLCCSCSHTPMQKTRKCWRMKEQVRSIRHLQN